MKEEKVEIPRWEIEDFGYEPKYEIWEGFRELESYGIRKEGNTFFVDQELLVHILHLFRCSMQTKNFTSDIKWMTEFVMVLNWSIWYWHPKFEPLARLYDRMWRDASEFVENNFKEDDLRYYYRTID